MKKINWDYIGAHILFVVLFVLAIIGFGAICFFILECHVMGWL